MTETTSTSTPIDDRGFGRWVIGIWTPSGTPAKIALTLAVLLNGFIFYFGSTRFGLPALPGFDGGLLLQPSPFAALVELAILLLAATLVGTALAGAIRFEAGLFSATAAMAVVSARCGTMQSVLLQAGGRESVYGTLFVELVILWIIVFALWLLLWRLGRISTTPDNDNAPDESDVLSGISATVVQVIATALIVMFFCQTEAKNQALVSVAVASLLGTAIAYKYFPARPSIWYWSGPAIVGLFGYALAFFGLDSPLATGNPAGLFSPLARPLPIDYASFGIAGAILGYWMMRPKAPAA